MDDEYMLFWRKVGRKYNIESINDYDVDIVTIKNGELEFIKFNSDHKKLVW